MAPEPKRVYQVWKGSNIFLLEGRLVFGPDARSLTATVLLIAVPVIFFCALVAMHLRHKFSDHNAGYAVFGVTIVFTIYVSFHHFLGYWCFCYILQLGIQESFLEILIHQRKSSVMSLQQQETLMGSLPQAYNFLVQKKSWLMACLCESSTVRHACYTAQLDVLIALFATTV